MRFDSKRRTQQPLTGSQRMFSVLGAFAMGLILCVTHGHADVTFTDVTLSAGVDYIQRVSPGTPVPVDSIRGGVMTGGAAAGDFDGDGWVDLYVTRLDDTDILFRNKGVDNSGAHLGFQDVSSKSFRSSLLNFHSNGAAWGDVDNDGDLDLYVTAMEDTRHYMFLNRGKNANGRHLGFDEVAQARGCAIENETVHFGFGVSFGDYDGDGFLDLFTGEWQQVDWNPAGSPSNARLLRNQGEAAPGYCIDATAAAGVVLDGLPGTHGGNKVGAFSPRFVDLDRDGDADLTIASDFGKSQLFWNNGDGTYTNGTVAPLGSDRNGMGSTVADYDGDGDLDWFVTAIERNQGNWLYRNLGFDEQGNSLGFEDATDEAGVRNGGWGWGTSFLDFDNDGDQDLVMTNGWPHDINYLDDQMRLWRNEAGIFSEVSSGSGITDTGQGRGLLTMDYDRDGDLDVFVVNNEGHPVLYRNDGGNEGDWLQIDTVGTTSNRDGIGATITVIPDRRNQDEFLVQQIDGGSNYLAQNEMLAHFGLGDMEGKTTVDGVLIDWPSGQRQKLLNVPINERLVVVESSFPFATIVPEPSSAMLVAISSLLLFVRRSGKSFTI